jgi:hypothetical protein
MFPLVFPAGEEGRLGVRSCFRQDMDRSAALLRRGQAVGVQGDKDLGASLARQSDSLAELAKLVPFPCQDDTVAAGRLQQLAYLARHRERDRLLAHAIDGDGAGVDPAMAWIDHDRVLRLR